MRKFIRGMSAITCIGMFVVNQACGRDQRKKYHIVHREPIDALEQHQREAVNSDEKSEAKLIAQVKEASCVFQEEAPPQNIANYGMNETRSLMLESIGRDGLGREHALQFALVNNPELFAYYENLEIAYAGLIEAGLRENPIVTTSRRISDDPGKKINRSYDTAISFLDYFLIPLRERAALMDLHVIESEVLHKVLELARDVEINWLNASIAELKLAKKTALLELKELAFDLAELQYKAGNISALKAREREIEFQLAQEELKGFLAELLAMRENLGRSLGLFGAETCFKLKKDIEWKSDPPLPELNAMEEAAIVNRPDLESLRREIEAIAQEAKLKEWWTYSKLKVGVSREQDTEGKTEIGPSIELEVPIFNHGQGEKIKYDAMLVQTQKKLLAQAIAACSEVREFFKAINIYRSQLESYDNSVLPNIAEQIETGLSHYNVMTLGVFDLFALKEKELEAMIEQLDALKSYEEAQVELLYATGGSFAPIRRGQ